MAATLGARVVATLPIVDAADRFADLPPPDVIVLDVSVDGRAVLDAVLDRLNAAAVMRHQASMIHCTPALIDVVAARAPDVAALSDASPTEYAAALALLLSPRRSVPLREGEDDAALQLRQLSEELGRIARALAQLSQAAPIVEAPLRPQTPSAAVGPAPGLPAIALVRAFIRARRLREHYFPADLFADPAWDMLLDLLLARIEGRLVAVSSLCIAAAVPPTTALRWIKRLTDEGLFVRAADPRDGRRVFIELSENAAQAMVAYVTALGRPGATPG